MYTYLYNDKIRLPDVSSKSSFIGLRSSKEDTSLTSTIKKEWVRRSMVRRGGTEWHRVCIGSVLERGGMGLGAGEKGTGEKGWQVCGCGAISWWAPV